MKPYKAGGTNSPCWNKGMGCPGRQPGCHAECEKFLAWKKADEARRDKAHAKANDAALVNRFLSESKSKWRSRSDYDAAVKRERRRKK